MTEYIGREEKCGDCIHVEVCERNPILTEFSRENPAYCKKFMKAADVALVRYGRWKTELDDLGWLTHTCTVCGYAKRTDIHVSLGWNHCPNCGARMDGGSR